LAKSKTDIIDMIRVDIQNSRAALNYGLELNDTLINGVWRHFTDVEILVPLATMELHPDERKTLASNILEEMDNTMAEIRGEYAKAETSEEIDRIHNGPLGQKVDSLWKELAGCYAEIINEEIPQLPDHVKKIVAESLVAELANRFDTTEEEIVDRIQHDSALRMMFRRTGIDPDEVV